MKFSDKLKALRKQFGYKQTDLANSLRVSPQAVSKWERDENYPDIFLLKKLSRLFDVSIDEMLGVWDENREQFEATVFCSSLQRFAERGRKLSAKELAEWTNAVFHHMTEIALRHGAVPVKYTGDGFLCFFSGAGHRDRALQAARDVERLGAGRETVVFLHAGEIYHGMVGHREYAARDIYGDTVNKAFLLLGAFAGKVRSGVGVSGEVRSALKRPAALKTIGPLAVPALKERITVYQVQ
jgi:class 3 adenylate cyclase